MKKLIFFLYLIIFGVGLYAQNLTLETAGHNVANGDTVTVAGDVTATLFCHINVTNTSASTMSVKCQRAEVSLVPGSTNSICWGGSCWPENVSLVPDPTVINAGGTSTEFSGDYKANGNSGVSIIRYRFFNQSNIADSICFHAKFVATLGVEEGNPQYSFSDVYPNPANNNAFVSYKISDLSNVTRMVVCNILGNEIISHPINESEGTIKIETSGLADGLYFYSVVDGNKTLFTKKLIVKHK